MNYKNFNQLIYILSLINLLVFSTSVLCQDSWQPSEDAATQAIRLDELVDVLERKLSQRNLLKKSISPNATVPPEIQSELDTLNTDIQTLHNTFELLTIGDVDDALFDTSQAQPFDWRVELMLVLEPLLDSLKALTEKPRQMTELKDEIALSKRQLKATENALQKMDNLPLTRFDVDTRQQVVKLQEKWRNQKESAEQRLLSSTIHLERLHRTEDSTVSGVIPSVRNFIIGRGLTLVMAIIAAAVSWLIMRLVWWVFSTHVVSKDLRRGSLWFRLLSYSFYLVNIIVSVIAVLAVLYIREDLLLLGLALLILAVMALGIRRYIPAYIREARLLLDLGSVREGERVIFNALPWQVMSINLHTVLWNPALDGIVRLPLEIIETLTSRPIKDSDWFPSKKGDFVLQSDGTFGEVLSQTPEFVQLRVRGGMVQWFRTADYYGMNIINLSGGKSFGVAVTFGFDYGLQSISLTEIPEKLNESVSRTLEENGYTEFLESLLVELKSASASSIDYLIYVSIKSEKAAEYFLLERLLQQTCVAVANEQGWNIPFTQMMVHYQAAGPESPQTS